MLRSATKQTRRVLRRSRTIPRVAQSVRQHSPDGTEGALGVLPSLVVVGFVVGIGGTIAYVVDDQTDAAIKYLNSKTASYRTRNTGMMYDQWSDIAPFREVVLHQHYDSNHCFSLHNLFGMVIKSKVDQITPATESLLEIINFFLLWKYDDDDKDIDSARLKKLLGSQCITLHTILTEIRDEEAKSWHQIESDNLNEVVDFLDKLYKVEMNR